MPRKKVSDDVIDAVNLPDDEEIVVNETRVVGRRKRSKPPEPEPPDTNDDESDEFEIVGQNVFNEGTIAAELFARLTGDEEEREEKELAESLSIGNVLVVRKPDAATDKFTVPCSGRLTYAPLRNLDFASLTRSDIEEQVREIYGGGHYLLQFQIGNQMQTGWNVSLADPPNFAAKLAAANAPPEPAPTSAQPPTPPANPLDSMLESLAKMKALKDALFGDTEKALEQRIDELTQELRDARNNQPKPEPQSETLVILEKALAANNPDLTDRLLEYAFPSANEGKHWIADLFKTAIEHKDEIAGVLAGIVGPPRQLPAGTVAGILGGPTPPAANIPRSNFQRRPPRAETGENADTRGNSATSADGKNADAGPANSEEKEKEND